MRATSRWTGLPASVRGVDTRPLRPAGVLPCAVNVIDRTVLGICSHAGRDVSQIASPSVRTPVPLPASGTTVIEMTRSLNTPGIGPKLNVRAIIDIDNEQAEIKELIAALGKHVKMEAPST